MRRFIAVVTVIVLVCGVAVAAQQDAEKTLDHGMVLLRRAESSSNPAAAMGLYRGALSDLSRLVSVEGIHNSALYYDLGNIYYRLGDVGRSILSYRRAELYGPSSSELAHNLSLARSKAVDHLPWPAPSGVLRLLFFWHYRLPIETQALVFALFFGLLWIGLVIVLMTGRRWVRWLPVGAGILAAFMLGSLIWTQIGRSTDRVGVVVAQRVTARTGDARSYASALAAPLHAGAEFTLRAARTGWYDIELANGATAWIPAAAARMVRPLSSPAAAVGGSG